MSISADEIREVMSKPPCGGRPVFPILVLVKLLWRMICSTLSRRN